MTQEEMRQVALVIVTEMVKDTFETPNSEKSKKVAEHLGSLTGISHLEIHRFQNGIINNNISNSFKEERAHELAWNLLKAHYRDIKKLPNSAFRGKLTVTANKWELPLNNVLTTIRALFTEIIEEQLAPQKKL